MIRSTLKRGIKKALGIPNRPESVTPAPPQPAPPVQASEEELNQVAEAIPFGGDEPAEAAPAEAAPAEEAPAAEAAPAAVQTPVEAAPAEEAPAELADDVAGEPILMEEVQEILDDMVRPALQADGGDITLLKIENNDIYVKLVGSCSSCPSSIMTMKMGVEALLKEEFPAMGELIQEQ